MPPIVTPDLALIPDLIVARLIAFPDLSKLTVTDEDEATHTAIVGINKGDLLSAINAAFAKHSVAVVVFVEEANVVNRNAKTVVYDPVKGFIEITELVELNNATPDSDNPGTGTGLEAWHIADRVVAAIQNYSIAGLASPYRVIIREPGIRNVTTQTDAEAGCKVLRIHWETRADSIPRE